jgi:hypothetical protein
MGLTAEEKALKEELAAEFEPAGVMPNPPTELKQGRSGTSKLTPEEQAMKAELFAEFGPIEGPVTNEMPESLQIAQTLNPINSDFWSKANWNLTRPIIKNLGGNPEGVDAFAQKENPNLEFKRGQTGKILARDKGTNSWGRLDPEGFDPQDITDIGYDVPAAIAQGAATAASGLLGAPAGGIGAIPAGIAGSVASGLALEGARQGLGSIMGIENNYSPDDLKWAGGAGAVSPLLFGTGASGAQALKMAGKEGAKQTAEEILKTQRGGVGRAWDGLAGYFGPKLGNLAGGENPKVIKKAAGMLKELKAGDIDTEVSALPYKNAAKEVPAKLREVTKKVGKQQTALRDLIDNQPGLVLAGEGAKQAQGSIDAKAFVAPFRDLVADLERTAAGDADKAAIAELKNIIQKEFTGMPEFMTAAQVDAKAQKFKNIAKEYGINYGKSGSTQSTSIAGIAGRVGDAFNSSQREMNASIIQRLEALDPKLAEEYVGSKASYKKLLEMAEAHRNDFKNATNVKNFLNRAMNDPTDIAANQLEEIQKITGVDLEELATRSQAMKVFSKPETEIRSLAKSVTPRQLALGAATGALGYYGAQQSGGEASPFLTAVIAGALGSKAASPAMLRKYMEGNKVMRELPTKEGAKFLPYLMMNMNKNDQGE